MTRQLAFVGRFLAIFALLIVAGWLTRAPRAYATLLRGTGSAVSPLLNGWSLEQRDEASGRQEIWFRRGTAQMRLQLGLEPLALGLLPLLSLFGATPDMPIARRAARAGLAVLLLFALDLAVLLLYPWLVGSPSPLTDIVGTFLGLLTFVGGPVILWFVLTYRDLRGIWRLG